MTTRKSRYSPEVKERAIRLVRESVDDHNSEWAAIRSIAEKIGCSPETLRSWIRQTQRDEGELPGSTTDEKARIKELEKYFQLFRTATAGRCHLRQDTWAPPNLSPTIEDII